MIRDRYGFFQCLTPVKHMKCSCRCDYSLRVLRVQLDALTAYQLKRRPRFRPLKLQPSHITAELPGAAHSRPVNQQRLLQQMMRMSAENGMDAFQPLCQQLICRQAEVGEDYDKIDLRGEQSALLPKSILRVLDIPTQQRIKGCKSSSGPGNTDLHTILFDNSLLLHPVRRLPCHGIQEIAAYHRALQPGEYSRQCLRRKGQPFIITDGYSIVPG